MVRMIRHSIHDPTASSGQPSAGCTAPACIVAVRVPQMCLQRALTGVSCDLYYTQIGVMVRVAGHEHMPPMLKGSNRRRKRYKPHDGIDRSLLWSMHCPTPGESSPLWHTRLERTDRTVLATARES